MSFTLTPFWLGYVIVLVACVVWAWRLSREELDAETADRERGA
jgi:hypothetical protein